MAAVAVVVAIAIIVAAASAPGSAGAAFASFLWNSIAAPAIKVLAALTGIKSARAVVGPGGTAVWNPDAGTGLGSGSWRKYVLYDQDEGGVWDGQVDERVYTNICKNGNKYPHCGAGWWGLVPVVGPAWDAHDAFRSGRWGWGIAYTAMAVSDVFLVKSIVTGGGRLLARGGTGIVERAMSRAELEATMMTGLASPAPMNIASLVGRPPGVHRVSPDLLVF